jgi:branched-chain amino acid transport system permease protein
MEAVLVLCIVSAVYAATLSCGFGLIFGTTRIFHLPFGSLGIGFLFIAYYVGIAAGSAVLGVVVGVLLAGLAAAGVHVGLYEPLLRTRAGLLPNLITAVGVFSILQAILVLQNDSQPIGLSPLLPALGSIDVLGLGFRAVGLIGLVVQVVALAGAFLVLKNTPLGLFVRAAGDNSTLAGVLGINLTRARTGAILLGSGLSFVAVFFSTWSAGVLSSGAALAITLTGTVGAFLGGVGSVPGAVIGGLVLGGAQVIASRYFTGTWADVVVYGALLMVILVRPQGLIGTELRKV